MPFDDRYVAQVRLLLQILPLLREHEVFALKGGTAINLFDRPLPRLSVDIDLAYLPVSERQDALGDITSRLRRIGKQARQKAKLSQVVEYSSEGPGVVTRLVLSNPATQIKIEVSPVLRGSVESPRQADVHAQVEAEFGYAEAQLLSRTDLYAGKFCAALDRQHPRDLFDVAELQDTDGLDVVNIETFLVYLISHNRPFHELLQPRRKDLEPAWSGEFQGMTRQPASVQRLIEAREVLIGWVGGSMCPKHRTFLMSVAAGAPDWALLSLTGVSELPAVRWKLRNIQGMPAARRRQTEEALQQALDETMGPDK